MSEKRIYCTKTSDFCLDLRFGRDINGKWVRYCASDTSKARKNITEKDCKNCKKARYLGITLEQAIDAMLNGMIEKDENSLSGAGFVELAEAALDALLEAHNGN